MISFSSFLYLIIYYYFRNSMSFISVHKKSGTSLKLFRISGSCNAVNSKQWQRSPTRGSSVSLCFGVRLNLPDSICQKHSAFRCTFLIRLQNYNIFFTYANLFIKISYNMRFFTFLVLFLLFHAPFMLPEKWQHG